MQLGKDAGFPRFGAHPSDGASKAQNRLSLQGITSAISRKKVYVLVILLIGLILGVAYAFRQPKYTADGALRIDVGRSTPTEVGAIGFSGGGDEKLSAEVAVLQTRSLLEDLARRLDLANKPDFNSKYKEGVHFNLSDNAVRSDVVTQLRKRISIERPPREEIITISCTTHSAVLSETVINTLISLYIEHVFKMRYGTANRVSDWMVGQLEDMRKQVQRDQEGLIDLQQKLGIVGISAKEASVLSADALESLTRASSEATVQRIISEARLRYLRSMDPNLIESESPLLGGVGNQPMSLLQTLRASQATAQANYASLLQKYDVNYPQARQAKAQLDALNEQVAKQEQRILKQAQVSFDAANANEQMTHSTLDEKEKQAFNTRDEMVRYSILQREYESHRTLYENLLRRLREAGIDAGLKSADVDVLDLAETPVKPAGLSKLLSILFGLFAGGFLGIMCAIVIDLLDDRLPDPRTAEQFLQIPLLSTLPVLKNRSENVISHPYSGYSEGMQLLRNNVLLSTVGTPPRSVLITSAIPGEGKSTTARNIAITFASHNLRTLLIDADLRRASQHKSIQVPNKAGLSNLLTTSIDPSACVMPMPNVNNMFFLPAGPLPPNPAPLLGSDKMRDLLRQLASQYDMIVVDSAPIASTTDTLLFCSEIDAVVLVVRESTAKRSWVEATRNHLQSASGKLIGFVMNGVTHKGKHSGYYGVREGYPPVDQGSEQ